MILVQKNGDSFAILISRLWASSISCKTVGPTLCPNGLVSTRAGNSRSKGRSGADRRRDDRERALELTISATLEACRSVACETHGGIHRAGLQGGRSHSHESHLECLGVEQCKSFQCTWVEWSWQRARHQTHILHCAKECCCTPCSRHLLASASLSHTALSTIGQSSKPDKNL